MKGTAGQIEAAVMARAQEGARRLGYIVIGGIFCLIAVGFLSAAAWIGLEEAYGDLTAALVLAGGYLVVGLVLIVMSRKSKSHKHRHHEAMAEDRPVRRSPYPQMAEAFVVGMDTAIRLRRSRERR